MGQQEIYEHEAFGEFRHGARLNSWLTGFHYVCKLICAKLLTVPNHL